MKGRRDSGRGVLADFVGRYGRKEGYITIYSPHQCGSLKWRGLCY